MTEDHTPYGIPNQIDQAQPTCDRLGCPAQAVGVVGIQFFPTKALMDYYHLDKPITRVIFGLKSCQAHLEELNPKDFMAAGFDDIVAIIEKANNITVDRDGCKVVRVPFDDPEYLVLRKASAS